VSFIWYLNRIRKMSLAEIFKRFCQYINIYYSQFKYNNSSYWPYRRFALDDGAFILHPLPSIPIVNDWETFQIYNIKFDLTKSLDWFFSDKKNIKWPTCHYARINYRPGNPFGDIRINWELNRLQFLPTMAVTDENLTKNILQDWLMKNPYLHGPSYVSSMEVALRWFSIYWAICLLKEPIDKSLFQSLIGLAIASGKFIESHLSTHSSAGNHLVVEATGLFWLGRALEKEKLGIKWITRARKILWEQIPRQINGDGCNREQSFWYLGFVLDALFHYFLLEERTKIPLVVWGRVEKMLEFLNDMILPDGSFPDYGDRDDGFVFRLKGNYEKSPFPDLLNIGSFLFNRPEWYNNCQQAKRRLAFFTGKAKPDLLVENKDHTKPVFSEKPHLKIYMESGMSLMRWGKGRLLFRHAPLGLPNTFGHGHADALSIIFYWNNNPVLIDLGSGQYNGDQKIRNYFRSTIAHNTVEIGGKNQSQILGPFLWEKSYLTELMKFGESPFLFAEAKHDGYLGEFAVTHIRKIEWVSLHKLEIIDLFSGPGDGPLRGAFHLGECQIVSQKNNVIDADFGEFIFSITFPDIFLVEVFSGSEDPFIGWRSTLYGKWVPIHSIVFSCSFLTNLNYRICLDLTEK
jgi:hypothetical protein